MAYYDPNEDPLNPNVPQDNQTGPQSGVISGQGSTPTQGGTPSSNTPAPDKPGNFVGIQQYLEQNKPQSAKLASTVGDYVSSQGDQAKTALAQGQGQFEQAVGQNTVGLDQDLFNQAKATPEQVASDEAKKAHFQKMRDAQYSGPASFEGDTDVYQPINLAIQNALGTANKTQSASGRSELLADMQKEKNERVSRGAANLDAALLSASPDSRTILSEARSQITPLQDQMKAVTEAENMKVKAAQDEAAKTQQAIRDAFSGPNGVQAQLENDLKNRAQKTSQQAGSDADAILAALKSGNPNLSDKQLQILGLNRNQYNGLLNDQKYFQEHNKATNLSDLSSFATRLSPDAQINPQNVATAEDYARYAALNDLMGTSNGFLPDASQAGKANPDILNFRYADTPSALSDRINETTFPVRGLNVPQTFGQVDQWLHQDPKGPALLAIRIAQNQAQHANNPTNSAFAEDAQNDRIILSNSLQKLSDINKAYGTNLSVPQSYVDQAMKSIQDNMQSAWNSWRSPFKQQPSDSQIAQAAQTAATVAFLSDLQKDISKVRG